MSLYCFDWVVYVAHKPICRKYYSNKEVSTCDQLMNRTKVKKTLSLDIAMNLNNHLYRKKIGLFSECVPSQTDLGNKAYARTL